MKKVLVAMSGGVDSSVAALLIKEKGYDVSGVFMKVWDEKEDFPFPVSACYSPEGKDIKDAKAVADILGISLSIIDMRREYKRVVMDYVRKEYSRGRTPNPCVICNRFLKFGILVEKAISGGAEFDFFATGHYAVVEHDRKKNAYLLKKGRDKRKDQSYFLCLLTQEQLGKLMFPLGNYTKKEVRDIALKYNLPVSEKAESQDFVSGNIGAIFRDKSGEGLILDRKGNILGKHKGIRYYTTGQRKGLGVAGGRPLYVVGIDADNNSIILGEKDDLYKRALTASEVNLISAGKIDEPLRCSVKIRYGHPAARATLLPEIDSKRVKIIFEKPQWAITPGQAVVFYDGNRVLGGGFIDNVL